MLGPTASRQGFGGWVRWSPDASLKWRYSESVDVHPAKFSKQGTAVRARTRTHKRGPGAGHTCKQTGFEEATPTVAANRMYVKNCRSREAWTTCSLPKTQAREDRVQANAMHTPCHGPLELPINVATIDVLAGGGTLHDVTCHLNRHTSTPATKATTAGTTQTVCKAVRGATAATCACLVSVFLVLSSGTLSQHDAADHTRHTALRDTRQQFF